MARPSHLRGTIEMLVLSTLAWGPRHGYAIARWLEEKSKDGFRAEEGTLYPALHRMEQRKLIVSDWRLSELGRSAKFYRLTPAGKRELRRESEEWRAFTTSVALVLEAIP
jgi:PadR family transcriptional regulator PadR